MREVGGCQRIESATPGVQEQAVIAAVSAEAAAKRGSISRETLCSSAVPDQVCQSQAPLKQRMMSNKGVARHSASAVAAHGDEQQPPANLPASSHPYVEERRYRGRHQGCAQLVHESVALGAAYRDAMHCAQPEMPHPAQPAAGQQWQEGAEQHQYVGPLGGMHTQQAAQPGIAASQQPLRQRLQARLQHEAPPDRNRAAGQAAPRLSTAGGTPGLSQLPLAHRLEGWSRSLAEHPEAGRQEAGTAPEQAAPRLSTESGGHALSQRPLVQRLRQVCGSTKRAAVTVKRLRPEGRGDELPIMPGERAVEVRQARHTPQQHRQGAQKWEPPQEQLQKPAVCPQPAVIPDSARSAAAQHASSEMRWQRPPRLHADRLQPSLSGRSPLGLQQALDSQQQENDEFLAGSTAQGTAQALRTPVATHASLAAAGDASTDLQWRRPLARRPQTCLNSCTPGMAHSKGTELNFKL